MTMHILFRRVVTLAFTAFVLTWAPHFLRAQQADFSGDWQTFWRTGSAVLSLEQSGDRVTGTYQPDDGRIEGTIKDRVLRGTWQQTGASGRFVFALSQDGEVLTGRFGNGEYWNGFRDSAEAGSGAWYLANGTPRETLRSLLLATNAAVYAGDAGALRQVANLVSYADPTMSAAQKAQRRALMFNILDMSTLRIMDVPDAPETADQGTARFDIGPAGISQKTTVTFREDAFGRWRVVLPTAEVLAAERDRLLAALGHDSMADLDRARALAVMDLSAVPERLYDLEGPIYADFVKRILDRVAYVIWQEIPDEPDRSVPYVYFQHPVGNITIARVTEPGIDGAAPGERWKISADTLETAPALLAAMRDLPVIGGLEDPEPLSPYFRLRETVRGFDPALAGQAAYLEIWQWLGIGATLIVAVLATGVVPAMTRAIGRAGPRHSGILEGTDTGHRLCPAVPGRFVDT